jgi:hypothetical protein
MAASGEHQAAGLGPPRRAPARNPVNIPYDFGGLSDRLENKVREGTE